MTERENRDLRMPAVMLPYQQKWIKDLSPVKVWEKSRRIGASWCEAADSALLCSSRKGMDNLYMGQDHDMAVEYIEDAAAWAKHYGQLASEINQFVFNDEDKDILGFRIRFASGFKMEALASVPQKLRSRQGRVTLDEAAFHKDLRKTMKAAMALLMWGGQVHIISTHDGDANPFNELVSDIRAGKEDFSLHRVTIDEALSAGLYKRICLRQEKDWSPTAEADWRTWLFKQYGSDADEELLCIPSQGSGVFLPRHLIEACMSADLPVLRLELPDGFAQRSEAERRGEVGAWIEDNLDPLLDELDPKQRHYFGEDFGRSGDLTIVIPLAEQADLTYRAPFIVELRNVPFQQQKQILFRIVERLPRFSGGALDARGNGQQMAEETAQRFGWSRVHQVMLTEPWYREQMPPYKTAFEDKTITLPRDADVMDDHRAFKMDKGIARIPASYKSTGADGGQRHADAGIAGALAWFAVRNTEYGEVEITSVETRRSANFGAGTF